MSDSILYFKLRVKIPLPTILNHSTACVVPAKSQWDLNKYHVIISSVQHNKS